MGNTGSTLSNSALNPCFHKVCNIIPDIPSSHHLLFDENEQGGGTLQPDDDDAAAEHAPTILDRRFDLDIAPSMLNMNLEWNGAYIVVAAMYNIIYHKYGFKYLASTQALHWKSVARQYRLNVVDPASAAVYKLTLSAILDAAQAETICTEKAFSIYSGAPEKSPTTNDGMPVSSIPVSNDGTFYKLAYKYMPPNQASMKSALKSDKLIIANMTLFTNFLNCTKGVVMAPTDADKAVGMLAVLLLGYDHDSWIVRFPFGMHWGDGGVGYVSFQYFERFSRDRWVLDIEQFRRPDCHYDDDNSSASSMFQPIQTEQTYRHEELLASNDKKPTTSNRRRQMF